jgi:hypothetical protein
LECKMLAANYVGQMMKYVEQGLTPEAICQELKICVPSSASSSASGVTVGHNPVEVQALPCQICEFVVGYLQSYLRAHPDSTVDQIEAALINNVCVHLASLEEECRLMVETEVPALMEALENFPPDEVCEKVHVCQDVKDGNVRTILRDVKDATKADVKATKSKARDVLKVRDEAARAARRAARHQEGQQKVQSEAVEDQARQEARTQRKQVRAKARHLGDLVGQLPCEVCEFVVGYIESYIQTHPDATIKQIEDALEQNICQHLGSLEEECDMIVESEVPAIVDALKTLPPEQVCTQIHLCTDSKKKQEVTQV